MYHLRSTRRRVVLSITSTSGTLCLRHIQEKSVTRIENSEHFPPWDMKEESACKGTTLLRRALVFGQRPSKRIGASHTAMSTKLTNFTHFTIGLLILIFLQKRSSLHFPLDCSSFTALFFIHTTRKVNHMSRPQPSVPRTSQRPKTSIWILFTASTTKNPCHQNLRLPRKSQ